MIRLALTRQAVTAFLLIFSILVLTVEVLLDRTQQIQMLDINSGDPATLAAALDGGDFTKAQEIVANK